MIRKANYAGSWYPGEKKTLVEAISGHFQNPRFGPGELKNPAEKKSRTVLGGIIPHAGYAYSGPGAAQTIHALFSESIPDVIVILGMTHTRYSNIACMNEGSWETPLGLIDVNVELANAFIKKSTNIIGDNQAFFGYHGQEDQNIEIQIPLIQYAAEKCHTKTRIVPVKIGYRLSTSVYREVASSLATVIKKFSDSINIAVIASSDLSHESSRTHGSVEDALNFVHKTDHGIRDAAESLDEDKLYKIALPATVCGPQTMFTLICLCKELGATKASTLKYYTSLDISPGYSPSSIVGYLSTVFSL